MSYLKYNCDENSLVIHKGFTQFKKKDDDEKKENESYLVSNEFTSIKIDEFLSKNELVGFNGELKFKELLDSNNVPYLYIGQGAYGIEKSKILFDHTHSKRPDFLLNIKDLGAILFDVKCRAKIKTFDSEESFFSLFVSEIKALVELQKSILIPVWLAFIERDENFNLKKNFNFISISKLGKFLELILQNTSNWMINVLRIPNQLFKKIDKKISFDVGHSSISSKILETSTLMHLELEKKLKDQVIAFIKNNKCYKSNISTAITSKGIKIYYKLEIDICVNALIKEKVILYSKYKYLSLS